MYVTHRAETSDRDSIHPVTMYHQHVVTVRSKRYIMFIYNTEISNGLICLCTNNMLSLFADDFYLFSWRETRDRETEGEQAKQMQQNRYTVKTSKKQEMQYVVVTLYSVVHQHYLVTERETL